MGDSGRRSLADLGETALLQRVFTLLPAGDHTRVGPGDDAAVVAAPDGRVVATTDMLVEGRDFRRDWSSAADVGWKAAAQNLADVAAMGAVPTALLVSLGAPPRTDVEWVLGFCEGLAGACAGTGAGVVGGDLSAAAQVVVSVTALGSLQGREPLLRSGARSGDVVAVAGDLGRSAAGWALLQAELVAVEPGLVAAHRRPTPPLSAGPAAALAGATAMLDVSDGLLRDLGRLADASGMTVDLTVAGSPHGSGEDEPGSLAARQSALLAAASALRPDRRAARSLCREWVLTGGEDHALVACFPPAVALPAGFTVVGEVLPRLAGWPGVVLDGSGTWAGPGGWDHFRG